MSNTYEQKLLNTNRVELIDLKAQSSSSGTADSEVDSNLYQEISARFPIEDQFKQPESRMSVLKRAAPYLSILAANVALTLLLCFLFLQFTSSFNSPQQSDITARKEDQSLFNDLPCDKEWELYNYEHCFKIFHDVGFQTHQDANDTCHQSGASLVSIRNLAKQNFVVHFLFNRSDVVDNVWIGAKYDNNKYQWEDGAALTYANWAEKSPKNRTGFCVQLHSDGRWVDEPCQKKNLVVCQKRSSLSIANLQDMIFTLRQALEDTRGELLNTKKDLASEVQSLENTKKSLNNNQRSLDSTRRSLSDTRQNLESTKRDFAKTKQTLEEAKKNLIDVRQNLDETLRNLTNVSQNFETIQRNLREIRQNPVPIGFIYVQLPNEKSPSELWFGTSWLDVSHSYSSTFFRVEGADAAPFGEIQEENAPRLVRVESISQQICTTNTFTTDTPRGELSKFTFTGYQGESSLGPPHCYGLQFNISDGEVRPRNMAMRVWKRIEDHKK